GLALVDAFEPPVCLFFTDRDQPKQDQLSPHHRLPPLQAKPTQTVAIQASDCGLPFPLAAEIV
ncbi:MAG: hypothetical protein WCC57_12160, partial [Paracoccaceae bacterium]